MADNQLVTHLFIQALGILADTEIPELGALHLRAGTKKNESSAKGNKLSGTLEWSNGSTDVVFTLQVGHSADFYANRVKIIDAASFRPEIKGLLDALIAKSIIKPEDIWITCFYNDRYWLEIHLLSDDVCLAILTMELQNKHMSAEYNAQRVYAVVDIITALLYSIHLSLSPDAFKDIAKLAAWMTLFLTTGKDPGFTPTVTDTLFHLYAGVHAAGNSSKSKYAPHVCVVIHGTEWMHVTRMVTEPLFLTFAKDKEVKEI